MADREQWRGWLAAHHDSASEVWLVFFKRHVKLPSVDYEQAVQEALCFGWIDSMVRRIDEDRYEQKFTPRKPRSVWSASNLKRFAQLVRDGRMTPAGLAKGPPAAATMPDKGAVEAAGADSMQEAGAVDAMHAPAAARALSGGAPGPARRHDAAEVPLPPYLEAGLRAHPAAWDYFSRLAPSHRRNYVRWVDSAKKQETRDRRLAEAIGLLLRSQKLGMK